MAYINATTRATRILDMNKQKPSIIGQAYKSVFNAKNLASIDSNLLPNPMKHQFSTERGGYPTFPSQDTHMNVTSAMSNQNKSLLLPSLLSDHYNTSTKDDLQKKAKFFNHVLKLQSQN